MLKTNLIVEAIGKPDITTLSNTMQNDLFESLLTDITDLFRHSQESPVSPTNTSNERKEEQ